MKAHAIGLVLLVAGGASLGGTTVYRCPGPPLLYTDQITDKEAKEKGCRTVENAPITVMQTSRPRPSLPAPVQASGPRSSDSRVDPAEQRARDSDARRILETELRREEEALDALKREFNNGEPERRGEERNYQKYLERVAEMRAAVERKEGDVAAIRREISKMPAAASSQ